MTVVCKTVLFLCSGNYYRSRFAEYYFQHRAIQSRIPWKAQSRGLQIPGGLEGPLSQYTREECERLEILPQEPREPLPLTAEDLEQADLIIAVKETEHRRMVKDQFPEWSDKIEYWEVHDLDIERDAHQTLSHLKRLVDELITHLQS
ncbi:MAG: low molecular weight phosphatase family protein [Acidobacteria bacterium]|nr:low molecular weight phosphatase family protein [Acidobacteriota bacterium]|tara:strand:+ start:1232 stop:1672 length:441 start_codon:yes stop_codon:yes gene_type:complete